jgi:hypothetical protein
MTALHASEAVTPAVSGAGTELAHWTVTGAGQRMEGGVMSLTANPWLQVLEQLLLSTIVRFKVKLESQAAPATTLTLGLLLDPEIAPSPLMDQR